MLLAITGAFLCAGVALTGDGSVLSQLLTSAQCLPGTVASVVFAMCLKVAVVKEWKHKVKGLGMSQFHFSFFTLATSPYLWLSKNSKEIPFENLIQPILLEVGGVDTSFLLEDICERLKLLLQAFKIFYYKLCFPYISECRGLDAGCKGRQ